MAVVGARLPALMVTELRYIFDQSYLQSEEKKVQSMSDRLFNAYDEKAKAWGQVYEDESADGRTLLRRRTAYYKARKELTDYIGALERTTVELDRKVDDLALDNAEAHRNTADALAEVRRLQQDFDRVSKEVEDRNRMMEKGPDQIGIEYIQRLNIPELTEVFNRVVLGK